MCSLTSSVIPARARGSRNRLKAKVFRQVTPIVIALLNQPDFPGAVPLLQPFLASDGAFHCFVRFEPSEELAVVTLGEILEGAFAGMTEGRDNLRPRVKPAVTQEMREEAQHNRCPSP